MINVFISSKPKNAETYDGHVRTYDYKANVILSSNEHKISTAHKNADSYLKLFLVFKLSHVVFIKLIKVKMPALVGTLTLMSMIQFLLS